MGRAEVQLFNGNADVIGGQAYNNQPTSVLREPSKPASRIWWAIL